MYNNNDYSRESGSSGRCSSRSRELLVGALSVEEWSYLRGLFLADGNRFHLKRSRDYRVKFDLQGDEEELVCRIAGLLKRAGLDPYVLRHPMKNMITVRVVSKSLFDFLPDKKALFSDGSAMRRFLEENDFFTAKAGIPFLAGLLDGDGCVYVSVRGESGSCFGKLTLWKWSLAQSAEHVFLVDYVKEFVESFVPDGVTLIRELSPLAPFLWVLLLGPEPFCNFRANILKPGIMALLSLGIARYSWKVKRWGSGAAKILKERSTYLTTEQAGRILGVNGKTVRKWADSGKVKCIRRGNRRYFPRCELTGFKEAGCRGGEDGSS